jgi:hypothetical protein
MSEESKDGDVSVETKEFDASAFGSGIVDSVEKSIDEGSSEVSHEDTSSNSDTEDDDSSFDWSDNYGSDENADDDNEKEDKVNSEDSSSDTDDSGNNVVGDSVANDTTDNVEIDNNSDKEVVGNTTDSFDGSLTDEHFTAFASELGIKAKTLPELKEAMLELEADNKRLQQSSGDNVTSKKITALQSYLKFDDNELIKKDLEAQGFKGEQLQETLDTLQDNGMLKIEATKVRNAISSSISNERSAITKDARDEDAKQLQDREQSVKALKTYLNDQNEMFGFKMAKDEETLGKVRDSHHKYITSGSFLTEITKDNESLAESAWLWKNRETLLKAARNGGLQQGRSEILNDMHNPDTEGGGTFVSPDGKGEFNVSKFKFDDKK